MMQTWTHHHGVCAHTGCWSWSDDLTVRSPIKAPHPLQRSRWPCSRKQAKVAAIRAKGHLESQQACHVRDGSQFMTDFVGQLFLDTGFFGL